MNGTPGTGPLAGLRILELAGGIAAPFAAKLLADLGAEVTRIESPGAAAAASLIPAQFFTGTSKRSITLALDTPAGMDVFRSLVGKYDLLFASETEGALAARGLGYEALRALNPGLVLVTVTGFGSTGPYAGLPAPHLLLCALGGWSDNCGLPDREPLQAGGDVAEYLTGGYAAAAALAAIEQRAKDGLGQHVDVCGMEAALTAALLPSLYFEYLGINRTRQSDRQTGPSWMFPCADGYIGVNVLTGMHWDSLCHFTGCSDVAEDPVLQITAERLLRAPEIYTRFAPAFKERKAEEIFHDAQEWRLPFGLVPSMTDLFSLAQHEARGFFVPVEHPYEPGRMVQVPGVGFAMSKTATAPSRPPRTGEHTRDVLRDLLGFDDAAIDTLAKEGVL